MLREEPTSKPTKVPILQLLGGKDRRFPYKQGVMYDAIVKSQGNHIETYVYENSRHTLVDSVATITDTMMKMILFLEKWKRE